MFFRLCLVLLKLVLRRAWTCDCSSPSTCLLFFICDAGWSCHFHSPPFVLHGGRTPCRHRSSDVTTYVLCFPSSSLSRRWLFLWVLWVLHSWDMFEKLLQEDLALALMLSFSYQRKRLSCWVKAWFPIDRCLVVFQVLGYHRLLATHKGGSNWDPSSPRSYRSLSQPYFQQENGNTLNIPWCV